ncbi:hypothetical protein [Niameybacter massiliensis]|uniref:hypothetical protein n=1 Tax=Niameybacter massiliensis TaxID=1658108 RepID=UPI0006B65576|nr:hypothetical protein [Niameybacter massiliensis]
MSIERTQYYDFETPLEDDFYDIEVHNRNMKKADDTLHNQANQIKNLSSPYVIPEGSDIPVQDRVKGKMYFKVTSRQSGGSSNGIIKVSPNMGIEIKE